MRVGVVVVGLVLSACREGPLINDDDPAAPLFDPTNPVRLELEASSEAIAALNAEPREYVPATLTLHLADGEVLEPIRVGLALKGNVNGSFRTLDGKAAFKINVDKFDRGQRLLGVEGMKLNNMVEDPSMLHEAIGYALFQHLAVPAARAGIAEVWLNGRSYGVHALLERVDDTWSDRHFDSTQHIYEGDLGLDVLAENVDTFEVDEGDPDDRSDLRALADVAGASDFTAQLASVVDVAKMCRMWIASQMLAHWDGYAGGTNNFYLHSDDDGRFAMIPSGLDQSMGDANYPLWEGRSPYANPGQLYTRCIADEECRRICDAQRGFVRDALLDFDALTLLDDIARALEPIAAADPFVDVDAMAAAQNDTRDFLRTRPGAL